MNAQNVVTEALVNRATGEVLEIGLQKTPDEIMLDASHASKALERLIAENKRPLVEFNGKKFLEYPHWQTIAKFFHATPATKEAEFVELGGVRGFKAKATVIDEKTGAIIGSAEAYCMTDEANWRSKPLFQLASMAQTRAACKALSNKYRYVAILAGYEPTAAEEMDPQDNRSFQPPREKALPAGPTGPDEVDPFSPSTIPSNMKGVTLTDKQRKLLFAKCRAAGVEDAVVKLYIKEHFGLDHTADLSWSQLDTVLKWIEKMPS